MNIVVPKENTGLAKCILDSGGVLISEQAPHYAAVANAFVTRNRIIAVLSDYTIPVEMSIYSGTRHTVHYAFKYGKKLILCKPNYQEMNEYPYRYEGITAAIKRYRGKENVFIISDLKLLTNCFNEKSAAQLKLLG